MWSSSVLPRFPTPSHSTSLTFNIILHSPSLNSGLSYTKAPPSQYSKLPRSQRFPTGRPQNALFATGNSGSEAVVVVDWSYGASGRVDDNRHRRSLSFVITGIDDPSVQSKVAAASDSGPEPSVK
ncbi:hypothetical protein BU17DRAFT_78932 [Hysterangium stoloniferum]|nr:hypothetical protein BU17DRAFT_78932 [Hysterangium stoloniferum]